MRAKDSAPSRLPRGGTDFFQSETLNILGMPERFRVVVVNLNPIILLDVFERRVGEQLTQLLHLFLGGVFHPIFGC